MTLNSSIFLHLRSFLNAKPILKDCLCINILINFIVLGVHFIISLDYQTTNLSAVHVGSPHTWTQSNTQNTQNTFTHSLTHTGINVTK